MISWFESLKTFIVKERDAARALLQEALSSIILKMSFPVSSFTLYLLLDFIPQQALRNEKVGDKWAAHLISFTVFHSWNADEQTFFKTFFQSFFFVDKQLIDLK